MARFAVCAVLMVVISMTKVSADTGYPAPAPAPVYVQQHIPILKDDRTQNSYGEYSFEFQSGNGIARQESGSQNDGQVSQGGWTYTSPEGENVEIVFVAGHEGYQPQGAVIPVAPPLPYTRTGHGF